MKLQFSRHRRLRQTANMRALVRENHLRPEDFIYPIFVFEGENISNEVSSMPGVFQFSWIDFQQKWMKSLHLELNLFCYLVFLLKKMNAEQALFMIMGSFKKQHVLLKNIILNYCCCRYLFM